MQISIYSQPTPNPNARKFILPMHYFDQSQNFSSGQAAAVHPLAARLFALGGIYNVFFAQDFVTVNKLPDTAWEMLEKSIQEVIIAYLDAHPPK